MYTIARLLRGLGRPVSRAVWIAVVLYIFAFVGYRIVQDIIEAGILGHIMRAWYLPIGWIFLAAPIVLAFDMVKGLTYLLSRYSPITIIYRCINTSAATKTLIATIFILFFLGQYNFHLKPIAVENFTLHSNKVSRPYHFIHISDVQFGSTPPSHIRKLASAMQKIIAKYPIDAILNTGDHIDSASYRQIDLEPLRFSGIPTLFSLGNHEYYHGHQRILETLRNLNYRLLRSSKYTYGEINVIGIDDSNDDDIIQRTLREQGELIDPERFNILMYHRPVGVKDAAAAGINLMLSGHTHGGQFYPFNWIVDAIFEFPQGLVLVGEMFLYTTDGVGLWGPTLRLGSQNELAVFHILPKN